MVTSLFKILFIYLFLAVLGLGCCTRALVAVRGGYSSLRCAGFSLRWLPLLRSMGSRSTGFSSCGSQAQQLWCTGFSSCALQASVVVALGLSSCGSWALKCRLSSSGTRASLFCGMWDLPGPGLEPVSPALAGGFLTAAPPGKPLRSLLNDNGKQRLPHL